MSAFFKVTSDIKGDILVIFIESHLALFAVHNKAKLLNVEILMVFITADTLVPVKVIFTFEPA